MTQDLSHLPPYAKTFLRRKPTIQVRVVYRFHLWLRAQHLALSKVKQTHLDAFLTKPFSNTITNQSRKGYRRILLSYLSYLYEQKLFPWVPAPKRIPTYRSHKELLPQCANTFIQQRAVTLNPRTAGQYRTSIGQFHAYLGLNAISLQDLQRQHLLAWFGLLKDTGHHPGTRLATIFRVRVYLRWLYELELTTTDPDDLIRRQDLPKLPDYLPRPLPLDIDHALQESWQHATSINAKGLLIMRKAGLRISELEALAYDCLREDGNNNAFLKVPLGKLNTERLVPISPEIAKLIKQLQRRNPAQRVFLIANTQTEKTKRAHLIAQLLQDAKAVAPTLSIQSHQLRHTAATELLNAGVSMPGLMKFLGHSDYRMTLRYARITQETLTKEFHTARTKLEKQYLSETTLSTPQQLQPFTLIANLIKWIAKNVRQHDEHRSALITKRLNKIKQDLQKLQNLSAGHL